MATSLSSLRVATIVVNSSGADVPMATMERPIIASGISIIRARPVAPSTSQSAPIAVMAIPAMSMATYFAFASSSFLSGGRAFGPQLSMKPSPHMSSNSPFT